MAELHRADLSPTWTTVREALVLFLTGRTARIATPVAAVVGTILSALNQGYRLTAGTADRGTWIRIGLNYVVPFCVSSYGYLSARRVRPDRGRG